MIVKQIWTANPYRNFNYLIACPDTGEALAMAEGHAYETKLAFQVRDARGTLLLRSDSDGVTNLLEYATKMNPSANDVAPQAAAKNGGAMTK